MGSTHISSHLYIADRNERSSLVKGNLRYRTMISIETKKDSFALMRVENSDMSCMVVTHQSFRRPTLQNFGLNFTPFA
jgi:hypothetical protein